MKWHTWDTSGDMLMLESSVYQQKWTFARVRAQNLTSTLNFSLPSLLPFQGFAPSILQFSLLNAHWQLGCMLLKHTFHFWFILKEFCHLLWDCFTKQPKSQEAEVTKVTAEVHSWSQLKFCSIYSYQISHSNTADSYFYLLRSLQN